MKKLISVILSLTLIVSITLWIPVTALASGSDTWCYLSKKIATRTGPGTSYEEPGTFFHQDYARTQVRVISKSSNGVLWVQIEFNYKGQLMRAYTGAKRLAGADLSHVPEEQMLGSGTVWCSASAWYGPGTNYAQMNHSVPAGTDCTVCMEENGYVLVEYPWYSDGNTLTRSWISAECLQGYGHGQPYPDPVPAVHPSHVRQARFWWNEEPEWSYVDISDVSDTSVHFFLFFYRIAYIDGTVFLDESDPNHGWFHGCIDYNDHMQVQGEVWFSGDSLSVSMNAHALNPVIEDRPVYRFLLR